MTLVNPGGFKLKPLSLLVDAIKRDDALGAMYFLGYCDAHKMLGSGLNVMDYILNMYDPKYIAKEKQNVLLHLDLWCDRHNAKAKQFNDQELDVDSNKVKFKWAEQHFGDFELVNAQTNEKLGIRISQGMLGYSVTLNDTRSTTPGFPTLKGAKAYAICLYNKKQGK